MATAVPSKAKSKKSVMMAAVDHKNYAQPPLDFSFKNIEEVEELVEISEDVVQPRWYVLKQPKACQKIQRRWEDRMKALDAHLKDEERLRLEGQKPIPKIDLWPHIEAGTVDEVLGTVGVKTAHSTSSEEKGLDDIPLPKIPATLLRINNNNIESLEGFGKVVKHLIVNPDQISWIDLSCNKLRGVSQELCEFTHLKSLYLHGNDIADISEIEKLSALKELITVTFHGNPLHGLNNYQAFVICTIPWIKTLDFVACTPDMKSQAGRWERVCGRSKIKAQGKALHQFEEKMREMEKKE